MSKTPKSRKIPKPKSGLYKFFKFILTYPLRFLCNMKVRGTENEPTTEQGAYLVIANHRTWADPIYLACVLKHGQPHFMAKKELFKIPLLNLLIRALGAYPVNRGGADVGAVKHTIEMLKAGVCVGMFPQGHRYNKVDPRKTPVKTGAAMIALKAGNAIVISPHPGAKNCILETFRVIGQAAKAAGAPDGIVQCVTVPSAEGTQALLKHPDIGIILATGGNNKTYHS